jgi:hypothetical protein
VDSVLVYGWQRMTVESGGATRELDNLSLVVLSRPGGGWMLAAYQRAMTKAQPGMTPVLS